MACHYNRATAFFISLGFLLNCAIHSFAQYQPKFQRLGTEDGLSENVVYAIHQDHHGYLWIGTWDGLNRYDGYTFKKFFHDPLDSLSLSGNTINCIYEDPQQQL